MTDLEALKLEAEACDKIWEESCTLSEDYHSLTHQHVCDFELLNYRYFKNRKKFDKLIEEKCRAYLSSIGEERDENLDCCDYCIHSRYLTISNVNPDLILNIATLGLDRTDKYALKGVDKLK